MRANIKTHCIRGHRWTEKNTKLSLHISNGKYYRVCRRCNADRMKLKYRTDDDYRQKQKTGASKWYRSHSTRPRRFPQTDNCQTNRNTITVRPRNHVQMTRAEMYEDLRKAVENTTSLTRGLK
jgi:hypothetical protein